MSANRPYTVRALVKGEMLIQVSAATADEALEEARKRPDFLAALEIRPCTEEEWDDDER